MEPFEELFRKSVALHGHSCAGQVLGVRMAMAGCRELGILEPTASRDLIVYVEIDRCAADAIQSVTGCKLGKRTLKYVDYGKMAATFLDLATGKAVRVLARDDSRERAQAYATPGASKSAAQLAAYKVMPEDELFVITPVRMSVPKEDMPGHPVSRVACDRCGEGVNDKREVRRDGLVLCRACAYGAYYQPEQDESASSGKAVRGAMPVVQAASHGAHRPPVIAIVGYSNSGKTTVATALIRALSEQGYRVAAVKHAHEGHQADVPGKDGARLHEAGAAATVLSSPGQVTTVRRTGGDAALEEIVAGLGTGYDLVIAEGFKGSGVPKVVVTRSDLPAPEVGNVIAVVGPGGANGGVPHYGAREVDRLAEQIRDTFLTKGTHHGHH